MECLGNQQRGGLSKLGALFVSHYRLLLFFDFVFVFTHTLYTILIEPTTLSPVPIGFGLLILSLRFASLQIDIQVSETPFVT